MSEPTSDDLARPGQPDDQQTQLQWQNDSPSPVLQTGIQAAPASGPRLDVGPVPLTRVAEYELLKEVGRGGMGVVFKARHVRLNRVVALKMIRGGALANSEELQRFEKEAAAAAQLQHPNIVALYEVSNYNQQPFLSMEYIGGTSLAERLSMGPLSGRRAAEYLEITARAVHYAHSRGIVHRDLKPANVLLDENDQPKVTDFGLAKQMQTTSDQTRTGAILGTPSYMSPEQAAGTKDISPASDVYSLGAILYELITGKPPFCGETPLKTLNLVAEQDPIPPRVLTPSVDRDLETICLKCLEKSPARRYSSAESLADDLHRYLQGEPITARRVGWIGRGVKWVRRNQAIAGMIAVGLLLVTFFIAYAWYETYQERELRENAVRANEVAENRLKAMRHLLYLSEMRQAQQAMRRADVDAARRLLVKPWHDGQTDLRDWEWYFLKDRLTSRLAFGAHHDHAFAVAYQPDGQEIASAGGQFNKPGEIKIWNARNGNLLQTLTGHTDAITAIAYHPTKRWLASSSYDNTVRLWDLDAGKEIVTLRGHDRPVRHVAFSPKGERLASASHDLTVRVWDYERYRAEEPNENVIVLKGHAKTATSVAFHPNGELLASGSQDKTIRIWDLANDKLLKELSAHKGEVASLVYSADGKMLVSGGGAGNQRGEVIFWNAEKGTIHAERRGLTDRILHLAMSRDGKVAAAGADGIMRVWQEEATEALSYRADPQTVAGVAFSRDGFTLVSAGQSGRISLWNSSAGSESLTLTTQNDAMETVAFSPVGPYLASAGGPRGVVRVWNLEHPMQPIPLRGHEKSVHCVAFSPDGRFVASGGADHTVRITEFLHADRKPVVLQGHKGAVKAIAYHPSGEFLVSADEDDSIRVWNANTGAFIKELKGHINGILCLAFSPDGNWLASGGYDKDNAIRLWNFKNNASPILLTGHTGSINSLSFSPDSLMLASASSDKSIRVWDVAKQKEDFKLEGSPGKVQSLAYHPGGRRLVSIGQDRMIRLWDIVTRQEILEFEEHVGILRCVAFSADGRSLAGAGNGVVRVWQASKEMLDKR